MIRKDNAFAQVPEWVLYSDVSSHAVRLYAVLWTKADYGTHETGNYSPSIRTLAAGVRVSTRTVQRAMTELERIGALRVTRRTAAEGDYLPNDYLLVSADPAMARNAGGVAPVTPPPVTGDGRGGVTSGALSRPSSIERGGDARPANNARAAVETPPRTNTTTTNTPSSPVVAAVRRFPEQCESHQTAEHDSPCRGCGRAREEHAAALVDAARARSLAESEENRRRAALAHAEVDRCRYCDPGGHRLDAPSMLCDHTPQQAERNKRGASAARAALARTSRGLAAVPEETLADACDQTHSERTNA